MFEVYWTSRRGRAHITKYADIWGAIIGFRSHRTAALKRVKDGVTLAKADYAIAISCALENSAMKLR